MATTTIPIPLTTFAPNSVIPIAATSIPVGATRAFVSIARNVGPHPIDAGPASDVLRSILEYSLDGGVTWLTLLTTGIPGTVVLNKAGTEVVNSTDNEALPGDPASTQRQVRGTLTTFATRISFSGTLVLS